MFQFVPNMLEPGDNRDEWVANEMFVAMPSNSGAGRKYYQKIWETWNLILIVWDNVCLRLHIYIYLTFLKLHCKDKGSITAKIDDCFIRIVVHSRFERDLVVLIILNVIFTNNKTESAIKLKHNLYSIFHSNVHMYMFMHDSDNDSAPRNYYNYRKNHWNICCKGPDIDYGLSTICRW